eukprot:s2273_g16.t1
MFCGCQVTQALDNATITFDLQKYLHQLKPLNIEKARKLCPTEKATPKEQSQLRGLLGGLAWPANQTQPHLAASVSLAQAASASASVAELLDANKTLRYAKETSDIHLRIRAHGRLEDLRFGVYSDASWCTRPDGSSQGGWLVFVATEDEINGSKPFPLTVLDWASRKLPRVCRSSLSAEVQTLSGAVDNLEWEDVMKWLGISPCITDARALYDASKSKAPGMKLQEKRTAIELKMSNERMEALGGDLRWCNSHQQLADGTTKTSARQQFAATLQRRMHCLKYDPEGTASKKVKQSVRKEEEDSLDMAAKEFERQKLIQDKIYKLEDLDAEEKEEIKVCVLPGCGLPAEEGKRHYHADQHKKKNPPMAESAAGIIWTLTMASQAETAEAFVSDVVVVIKPGHILTFILVFVLILVFVYNMGIRAGRRQVQARLANLAAEQNPAEPEPEEPTQVASLDQITQTEGLEFHDDEGVQSDPSPRTRSMTDCRRYSAGEIEHIVDYGFTVLSDDEVNRRRQRFIDSLEPSIEDYLPQSEIDRIVRGEVDVPQVPLHAAEWNGIGRQQRAALLQVLEDSLLLGVDFEEMDADLQREATCLRAELATIRAAGVTKGALRHQQLRVSPALLELPPGTRCRLQVKAVLRTPDADANADAFWTSSVSAAVSADLRCADRKATSSEPASPAPSNPASATPSSVSAGLAAPSFAQPRKGRVAANFTDFLKRTPPPSGPSAAKNNAKVVMGGSAPKVSLAPPGPLGSLQPRVVNAGPMDPNTEKRELAERIRLRSGPSGSNSLGHDDRPRSSSFDSDDESLAKLSQALSSLERTQQAIQKRQLEVANEGSHSVERRMASQAAQK